MKNRLSVCIFSLGLAFAATSPAQTNAPAAAPAATRQVIPAITQKKEVPPEVMQRINEETKVPFKYGIIIRGEENQFVDCPSIFRQNGQWYMVYISTTSKTGYQTGTSKLVTSSPNLKPATLVIAMEKASRPQDNPKPTSRLPIIGQSGGKNFP